MKTMTKKLAGCVFLAVSITGVASANVQDLTMALSATVPDTSLPYFTVTSNKSSLQFNYDAVSDDFKVESATVTVSVGSGTIIGITASTTSPTHMTSDSTTGEQIEYDVTFGDTELTHGGVDVFGELANPTGDSTVTLFVDPEKYDEDKHSAGTFSGSLHVQFDGTLT
ncbi:hypothetical protein [Fangia hongkongensis]|uniref:hypothetical protein n=1 Tax=Fangia hongkongensis TaxID=270495 RepID=UPI000366452C|nr:hypothetical protein [Fangia hongkongensis]MBK2126081.1 hypothetical protein [Fangia hongkongensis]